MADVEGPVEFGNGCNAVTSINLAQRFGSGKDERSSSWSGRLNFREGLHAAECEP